MKFYSTWKIADFESINLNFGPRLFQLAHAQWKILMKAVSKLVYWVIKI